MYRLIHWVDIGVVEVKYLHWYLSLFAQHCIHCCIIHPSYYALQHYLYTAYTSSYICTCTSSWHAWLKGLLTCLDMYTFCNSYGIFPGAHYVYHLAFIYWFAFGAIALGTQQHSLCIILIIYKHFHIFIFGFNCAIILALGSEHSGWLCMALYLSSVLLLCMYV